MGDRTEYGDESECGVEGCSSRSTYELGTPIHVLCLCEEHVILVGKKLLPKQTEAYRSLMQMLS